MAKKEFTLYGKDLGELKAMSIDDFAAILPSRQRRSLKRGFTSAQKRLLADIRSGDKNVETHCRDMIIIPEMIGAVVKVHDGAKFVPVRISEDRKSVV